MKNQGKHRGNMFLGIPKGVPLGPQTPQRQNGPKKEKQKKTIHGRPKNYKSGDVSFLTSQKTINHVVYRFFWGGAANKKKR